MTNRNILVICLFITLLNPIYHIENNIQSLDKPTQIKSNNSNAELEIKIQSTGSVWEDDSVTVWSPSDFEENREMQFSISFSDSISLESVAEITISLLNIDNESSPIEVYNGNAAVNDINQVGNRYLLYSLHTYPSEIPQGNYSASATINLIDGASISANFDIEMNKYSTGLNYDNNILGFCYGQSTGFYLTYRNTGGPTTELQYEIFMNTTFSNDWSEQIEIFEGNLEMMGAGEESTYRFEIYFSEEFDDSDLPEFINISITAKYIDSNRNVQTLSHYDLSLETYFGPCSSRIIPQISEIVDGLTFIPIDVSQSPNTFANAISPHINDTYKFRVELFNRAVSDVNFLLELQTEKEEDNFLVSYSDDLNEDTLLRYNKYYRSIESLEKVTIDFTLRFYNFSNNQIIPIELVAVNRDNSIQTSTIVELLNPYNENILSSNDYTQVYQNDSSSVIFNINKTKFGAYDRFEDNWILEAQITDIDGNVSENLQVMELINLNGNILFQNVEFDTVSDLQIKLNLFCLPSTSPSDYFLSISLKNNPQTRQSMIKYTIELVITVLENDSLIDIEPPTNGGNNDSMNNSSEQNNTQNQSTVTDSDNDGVLNSQDLCPNTAVGETVDSSGCPITLDDTDSSDNSNDGLLNDTIRQQDSDTISSKSSENNLLPYIIGSLACITLTSVILIIRNRIPNHSKSIVSTTSIESKSPLPVMPLPALEPVVLQQWTDANGYSWRQMSDQTIMWWNGTDWIPYGKN